MAQQTLSKVIENCVTNKTNSIAKVWALVGFLREAHTYQKGGVAKQMIEGCLIEPETNVIKKFVCFSEELIAKFKVGQYILATQCLYRSGEIVFTVKSSVTTMMRGKLTEEQVGLCRTFLFQPVPVSKIGAVKVKQYTSLLGKVTQVSERMAIVKDIATPIKDLTISDDTGSIRVTLWKELSTMQISIGQVVKISNITIKEFDSVLQGSSTKGTVVEIEAVVQVHQILTIMGVEQKTPEGFFVLADLNGAIESLFMPRDVTPIKMRELTLDELTAQLPLTIDGVLNGSVFTAVHPPSSTPPCESSPSVQLNNPVGESPPAGKGKKKN